MSINLDIKNILLEIDESRIKELRAQFDEFYPQDIAEQIKELDNEERKKLFDILSYKQGAEVFAELEESEIIYLFEILSNDQIVRFSNEMELDDAADIIGLLDDQRAIQILERIQRPFEIKELLSYEPYTCGGIMSPHFISVRDDLKCGAALRYLRLKAREDKNEIMYIYVTKKFGELAGVISLRHLFKADDDAPVSEHMMDEVIAVNVDEDQEIAAELISKYNFYALPVVNEVKQLSGIITVDDIVDVIEDEATEDIYQSSGINVDRETDLNANRLDWRSFLGAYKARTPWIVITLCGQCLAALLIAQYDTTIAAAPIAFSFMPLLSGMSGNIGNQSTTIVVRGMSLGEIDTDDTVKIFSHELLISLGIGLTCAFLTGGLAWFLYHNALLAILIAASLVLSMAIAVGFGSITPLVFKGLDIDPAIASGPLITTAIDMISFFVYLALVTRFVTALVQ